MINYFLNYSLGVKFETFEKRRCAGKTYTITGMNKLEGAWKACLRDPNCGAIYRHRCLNGHIFKLCNLYSSSEKSMKGSCIYRKKKQFGKCYYN